MNRTWSTVLALDGRALGDGRGNGGLRGGAKRARNVFGCLFQGDSGRKGGGHQTA